MIHVIEGDGKGKTTAAVGMAVRAAGHGFPVIFIQFLKDDSSGEIRVLKRIPGITVIHAPINCGFTFQMTTEQRKESIAEYEKLISVAIDSDSFLLVLDEVIHALNACLISKESIERVLEKNCEIVLTGRCTPSWLIERADYYSDIRKVKHPYDNGVTARIGIEF